MITSEKLKKMKPRFQRVTSKRQVTLPAKWSEQFGDFDQAVVYPRKNGFFIQPIPYAEDDDEEGWETFIDFTEGGTKPGLPFDEVTQIIERVKKERNGK